MLVVETLKSKLGNCYHHKQHGRVSEKARQMKGLAMPARQPEFRLHHVSPTA